MLIEQYLIYLDEIKFPKWLKDIGIFVKDLYVEPAECKLQRTTSKYMYLLHGTRPKYVDSIKRNGLKISMAGQRSREEDDMNWSMGKQELWLSTKYNKKSAAFGHNPKTDKVIMMIVKVDTKFLKSFGSTYTYNKDVPPKDIVWQNHFNFLRIVKRNKCLRVI